ncbi:HupE/UreJ family protein [Methylomicrobium sp. Wu6]|uniref:HupE/UreJ family protein n=1 Tax=Methylomicrobium sp. Wu6 TaxID=3107928 RepID=UPI002DD693EE|nr:HupE/UreJ family protein [Methylomicrobium sp. Wu6]MEC4747430.1 HupE/UreJ family protein [Methylomicrobium sp. Wu6]
MLSRLVLCLLILAYTPILHAHKASDSYLTLKTAGERIDGRWDIALRDLDYAIGLDSDDNGEITWGEMRSRRNAVFDYARSHLSITGGNVPCPVQPGDYLIDTHTDGAYSVLTFTAACGAELSNITVNYSLLFDLDPQHRGLLRVEYGQATHTTVLSPTHDSQQIELSDVKPGAAFLQYLKEGVWHIWFGYDHILFLLSLLFPSVLIRLNRSWLPAEGFHPVLIEVIKIVTAFTVAHSLTLSLATLGVIELPSRWVESAIAASVVLAALNNVYPLISKKLWLVAFGFGLIHGLGFANVLKDLGLPKDMLILALLAFNLGVEAGQLAIVSVFLPAAFFLRRSWGYRRLLVDAGSVLIAMVALVWLAERSLNTQLVDWELLFK